MLEELLKNRTIALKVESPSLESLLGLKILDQVSVVAQVVLTRGKKTIQHIQNGECKTFLTQVTKKLFFKMSFKKIGDFSDFFFSSIPPIPALYFFADKAHFSISHFEGRGVLTSS